MVAFYRVLIALCFCQSRVSQNGVTQCGVEQSTNHGNLYRPHELSSTRAEGGEAKDPVAVSFHEGLKEPSCFGKRVYP
jgi:hypothetical protein